VKQRKSSVEHGVTCDRRDRKVRGPATRDVIRPKGHKPRLAIGAACHLGNDFDTPTVNWSCVAVKAIRLIR
jgi:hypothetical protein